ncbi:MAG: hypothetical protein JSV64_00185 [Candidatus Bathyarchaeota archaeon]|nr:MAG: hypothetical protein JSV64_00185 [Candidatus Bathyarchaeota archaeon]
MASGVSRTETFGDDQALIHSISHVHPLRVVFVGFQESVVNISLIDSNVQKTYLQDLGDGRTVNHSFNTSYDFANSSYYEALKAFILINSVNGTATTSALNTTALQIQKSTGTKMSIFKPQSGRAINATAIEEWFVMNPLTADSGSAYSFYIMNFTEFDSPDHVLEHWYNVSEIDFEANSSRNYWRLEWDNALNPDVRFPYACFTSQSRVMFLDPSAFQWYLSWARIWWGLYVGGPKYDYYYEDLDEFLRTHDVGTAQGKSDLAAYLAGWIEDALRNLLAPSLWTSTNLSRAKSLSLQTLILNNASDFGYTNEFMSWMINASIVEEAVEDLAPFIDVSVTVSFENLSVHPQLEAIFDGAVISKTDDWTFYDGGVIWDGLYSLRGSYFNLSAADVVINSYIFFEKNMSMVYGGGEYTGLGGGGQILVMKEAGRYFKEDGISPKSGLGVVFIHEAGHNLGFPHTFVHGARYAGDFAFDVMGYYPYSYHFTQLRKDCFIRLVVDYRVLDLWGQLDSDLVLYSRKDSTPVIDAEFAKVEGGVNETLQLYDELAYLDAYQRIVETEGMELNLQELIWIYLCDLNNDGDVNIFDIVEAANAYGAEPGDGNWNPSADLIQDGLIDIFDIVLMASHYLKAWQ